jgi:Gram-negative bacterial TonB protein C-terminal
MTLYTRICLSILPVVFLGEGAFAQCPHTSQDIALSTAPTTLAIPKEQEQVSKDRTVFLELTLNKKGAVQDATLTQGPTALREAAVKAVKKRNYKREMNDWPFSRHIVVEVKFGQDNRALPEIRHVMWGGVPGCVYPTAIRVAPEVMQAHLLKRVEPVFPLGVQPVEDTIVLRVRIDKDGNVLRAEKVTGPDTLAAPAIQAVKAWKYKTYTLNGYPFEVETTVELKFPE